jgi:hypothetical protein
MGGNTILGFVLLVGVANGTDDSNIIIDNCVDDGMSTLWLVNTNKGPRATAFPMNVFVPFASKEDAFFFIQLTLFCCLCWLIL